MKYGKLATALGLGAISLSVLGTNLISSAAAATANDPVMDQPNVAQEGQMGQTDTNEQSPPPMEEGQGQQEGQQEGPNGQAHQNRPKLKDVKKTVTNLENGVQVTCTSTDADTVKALQSMKRPEPPKGADSKVTIVHSNIANGIQVTITSTDAETVKKIQEHEKNGGGPMGRQNGQNHVDFSKVQKSSANLENGATITLTSTDAATVSKIQDFAKNFKLPPNGRPGRGHRMDGQGRQGQGRGRQNGQSQRGSQGQNGQEGSQQGPQGGAEGGQGQGPQDQNGGEAQL